MSQGGQKMAKRGSTAGLVKFRVNVRLAATAALEAALSKLIQDRPLEPIRGKDLIHEANLSSRNTLYVPWNKHIRDALHIHNACCKNKPANSKHREPRDSSENAALREEISALRFELELARKQVCIYEARTRELDRKLRRAEQIRKRLDNRLNALPSVQD